MSNYTGAVDWRDTAACRTEDPELFFPKGDTGTWLLNIETAKTICRRCPAVDACLQHALDTPIPEGIYGGLTEQERITLKRAKTRRALDEKSVAARAEAARKTPKPERTMQSIADEHTSFIGGHLIWTGPDKISFHSRSFTPRQLCFAISRGHYAVGRVNNDCGISTCVRHLTDQEERGLHGNRTGYQRHRANGEEACDACRQANTDADNRLRWTGTTKAAV